MQLGVNAITGVLVMVLAEMASPAVTMEWVNVGDTANPSSADGRGSVSYSYQIGKYEVTNSQYVQFLNSKARSDPLGLYNVGMTSSANGGITRSGVAGSYAYSVKPGRDNQPVCFVTWYSATRFVNWLHNGQGSGDTESGAYTLLGGTPTPSNGISVARNTDATFVLPSVNEWYKAAFYQPASTGGDSDGYWLYPTRTNTDPNSDQPPGDPSIQTNVANYIRNDSLANGYNDGYAVTGSMTLESTQNYLTDVGAYSFASSYYGTFDQGGNVREWNEGKYPIGRGAYGGEWSSSFIPLKSTIVTESPATNAVDSAGFRIAVVPDPGAAGALGVCSAVTLLWRRR
jgi:formylglycine-generating enzyme